MQELLEKLSRVQQALKAPKDRRNSFGNYEYRSAEGILEALKPLLKETGLTQTITDEVRVIGERYYIVATVTVLTGDQKYSVEGWAREEAQKKGMDEAQITGAASSYARKYALNGMYNIDDTKDPDTDEYKKQAEKKETPRASSARPATANQLDLIKKLGTDLGKDEKWLVAVYDRIHSAADASSIIQQLKDMKKE